MLTKWTSNQVKWNTNAPLRLNKYSSIKYYINNSQYFFNESLFLNRKKNDKEKNWYQELSKI